MIADAAELSRYVERGRSEIRWDGPKISHFELLRRLLSTQAHAAATRERVRALVGRFDEDETRKIIEHVDDALPPDFGGARLTQERKIFIAKLIKARIEFLTEFF